VIEPPQIVSTQAQLSACIHLTVARADMPKVMGPAVAELIAAVQGQGLAITGPLYTHHFRRPTDSFDFEVCFPVSGLLAPVGRVVAGKMPATTVARTVYQGGYEGLGAAWGEFEAWVLGNGHAPAGDLWECYLVGPESGQDPANWRTELNRPLLASA
jgi:effector-binding domain-containing protein